LVEIKDVGKIAEVLKVAKICDVPFLVLGNGSNLLISDKGVEGAVLKICDDSISTCGNKISCAAGVKLSRLALTAKENSLSGLEFAWGIPGTVGGAIFMNAGAYGGEIKQVISSCKTITLDGDIKSYSNEEMGLGYRTSAFKSNNEIILSAEFELITGDKTQISATMDDYMERRRTKQPLELPSAGSTFKRPEGYFAGALIEQCGLKGFRIGDAAVSEKHAGFTINLGKATANDVLSLIEHIKSTVLKETGVLLEPEVIFKGR
jgi:UDP-N-acetylmuramate dehydrogenase